MREVAPAFWEGLFYQRRLLRHERPAAKEKLAGRAQTADDRSIMSDLRQDDRGTAK